MALKVHIVGPSGAGATTTGKIVSGILGYDFFDTDDYFWLKTDPPFTTTRGRVERAEMLLKDLRNSDKFILSGSVYGWAGDFTEIFDLVIFIYVPNEERMERLHNREEERYGERILPGGDMYENSVTFLEWAKGYETSGTENERNMKNHIHWMETLKAPMVKIENICLEDTVEEIRKIISITNKDK